MKATIYAKHNIIIQLIVYGELKNEDCNYPHLSLVDMGKFPIITILEQLFCYSYTGTHSHVDTVFKIKSDFITE